MFPQDIIILSYTMWIRSIKISSLTRWATRSCCGFQKSLITGALICCDVNESELCFINRFLVSLVKTAEPPSSASNNKAKIIFPRSSSNAGRSADRHRWANKCTSAHWMRRLIEWTRTLVDFTRPDISLPRGRPPRATCMLITRWDYESACDVSIWSELDHFGRFSPNPPRDHKNSKCEFDFFFPVVVVGVIILPAFASQLAHKLILNSRFGIPQLGVFVRNNLTRTPFVHRLWIPALPVNVRCLGVGWNELAKARQLLNYSKLYHPNEMKHLALILLRCKENKWVFFPLPSFPQKYLAQISIEQNPAWAVKLWNKHGDMPKIWICAKPECATLSRTGG